MRKIFGLPCFLFSALLAFAARAGEVSFSLSPSLVTVGEGVQATFTFTGTRSAPEVDFPVPEGVLRRGTTSGSSFSTGGGATATRGTTLIFTREGTYTLGPFDVDYDGEVHHLPATNVVVRPVPQAVDAGGEENAIRLSATADAASSVPGFPFSVTLSLLTSRTLPVDERIELAGGIPAGLVPLALSALGGVDRTERDGKIYNVRRYRLTLQAERPGTYALAPVVVVGIPTGRDRSFGVFGADPFGFDPFGTSVRREQVASAPLEVVVSPLPLDRAPEGFSGGVGVFRLAAEATPDAVAVGEPVTVTLSLEGVGNIAQIPLPEYGENDAWKSYAPRAVGDSLPPKAVEGRRTHEQVVIPRTTELTELPALELVVYDVSLGDFRTLKAGPFPLAVSPAADGAESAYVVSAEPAAQPAFPTAQAEDIAYLKEPDADGAAAGWSRNAKIAWYAGIPLLSLLVAWRTARARRLRGDTAATRRLQAPKAAKAGLRAARKACEKREGAGAVFEALRRAAADWFAHRANLPPGAVGQEKILRALEAAGENADALASWKEFFALADRALYAPSSISLDDAELAAWCGKMEALLRSAERLPLKP